MTKTARVYKIEMLIRHRGHVSFATLLDELEVSPATLKRDLQYLRDRLHAPIVYDAFDNGYRFDKGAPAGAPRAALCGARATTATRTERATPRRRRVLASMGEGRSTFGRFRSTTRP